MSSSMSLRTAAVPMMLADAVRASACSAGWSVKSSLISSVAVIGPLAYSQTYGRFSIGASSMRALTVVAGTANATVPSIQASMGVVAEISTVPSG